MDRKLLRSLAAQWDTLDTDTQMKVAWNVLAAMVRAIRDEDVNRDDKRRKGQHNNGWID